MSDICAYVCVTGVRNDTSSGVVFAPLYVLADNRNILQKTTYGCLVWSQLAVETRSKYLVSEEDRKSKQKTIQG